MTRLLILLSLLSGFIFGLTPGRPPRPTPNPYPAEMESQAYPPPETPAVEYPSIPNGEVIWYGNRVYWSGAPSNWAEYQGNVSIRVGQQYGDAPVLPWYYEGWPIYTATYMVILPFKPCPVLAWVWDVDPAQLVGPGGTFPIGPAEPEFPFNCIHTPVIRG